MNLMLPAKPSVRLAVDGNDIELRLEALGELLVDYSISALNLPRTANILGLSFLQL